MKKLLLLATLFVSYSASSQVILSENFEGVTMPALPAGWTSTTAVDGVWETGDAASANAG